MRMTQADAVIPLRSAAIDVMQGVSVANGREAQLQSLQGGHTYAMLKTHVFPRVQRIEYTAVIQHTASSTSTDAVNLRSLYQTASTFARGSKDYNDIIELAAQLYPDNAVAAINAAGVALTKGEKDKAEKYLSKWLTDPLAYQNLGVLYLLKGEQARAEVYLKKAAEMGVDEAAKMLHDGSLFL
jgi:tetratricopeptide (TPR) repeat protein